ncbi:helix-turn-helix transcriptional regulator [Luteolibacter sp. SL250]|uniref:helix-turn-helix domain-containing protein n=1 Tax=Luteolibacter sp. SL250 TaxID=2995170 RepID=UPI00226E6928|nr:helix-turn-helix transcriptional regulator [Luteolibacter sp. SL250]WAC20031.1 helix-turn-helix transcriptional regulator [Luteolibacter sp. SL250]
MSNATPEPLLGEEDIRAIVRLLGEVIAMRGDINACRRRLMEGLCQIVGADSWVWCMADIEPGRRLGHTGILHGGFDDERFSSFLQALNHPCQSDATRKIASELEEHKSHITRSLHQMEDPRYPVLKSDAGPFWEKADVGTVMVSLRPIESGGATGIGIYRRKNRPDFDSREVRIAHILLTEVPWLHYEKFPEKKVIGSLYPRLRTVLNLLCDGWDRKKTAAHLGISLQTVNGYVKEIFRHFEVHSQAELIARFGKGDGGDR